MRYRRRLAAILAAGALLRLGAILAIPTQPVSDFWGYLEVARHLAASGLYETEAGIADAKRSPAYPVLLAGAVLAAPEGGELRSAKLVNLGLFVLAGLAGAALSRRLWGDAAALWTAGILALLPRSILMTNLLAAENLIAPLLLGYLLFCVASWQRGFAARRAATLGLLAGLLCLTRAVFYFVPIVWLVGALAAKRRGRTLAIELVVMLAVAHAVMLPWAIRNAIAVGRFTPWNLSGGVGLFIANNPNATGAWYPWGTDLERSHPGILSEGDLAIDDAARTDAARFVREHPGRAAQLYLRRLVLILKDDGFAAEWTIFADAIPFRTGPQAVLPGGHPLKAHRGPIKAVLRISGLLLALAALGGFLKLLRDDRVLAAGFLAAALYVPLVSAAMAVNGRYRWAAEDAISPVAALFLSSANAARGLGNGKKGRPEGRP